MEIWDQHGRMCWIILTGEVGIKPAVSLPLKMVQYHSGNNGRIPSPLFETCFLCVK